MSNPFSTALTAKKIFLSAIFKHTSEPNAQCEYRRVHRIVHNIDSRGGGLALHSGRGSLTVVDILCELKKFSARTVAISDPNTRDNVVRFREFLE